MSRAVLIGAGDYTSPELPDIPAVSNNLSALRDTLTDPTRGVFSAAHCAVEGLARPTSRTAVGGTLRRVAAEATDLLLVYYSGHGVLDDGGNLHLAFGDTEPDTVAYSGIPVSRIKLELGQARARARVLVLDCCFSGQAIAAMASPSSLVPGQLRLEGTYTLASSSATKPSFAPTGSRHTAFTAALLDALGQAKPLTLDEIYQHVHKALTDSGLPTPQRRATNSAERLALVRPGATAAGQARTPALPPSPASRREGLLAQVLEDANRSGAGTPVRRARGAPAAVSAQPGADGARAQVIEFWRAVEMFSPQKVGKANRDERRTAVVAGKPLPWEMGHELARRRLEPGQAWRHVVYLGVHRLEPVFEVVRSVFEPDEDSYDERPSGDSALAVFAVGGDGRPLVDSQVLGACGWATSRLLNPGPDAPGWLSGFDDAADKFDELFEDLMAPGVADGDEVVRGPREHESGLVIDEDLLARCLLVVEDLVRLGTSVPHGEIRIESQIVPERKALSTDGLDFINSALAEDLVTVAEQVRAGQAGAALRDYLRPDSDLAPGDRVDVREQLDVVLDAVAPARIPLGRWPADPEHSLALGQQLAVNRALMLADGPGGVFGVNGPPGTGKTTMLRDIVAALVVRRACGLAELRRPGDAFTGETETWQTSRYVRVLHRLKPQITGFEVAVASANNTAVENVTNEMPARNAIDDHWRAAAASVDYFPGIASSLLGGSQDTGDAGWALLSARLGKKANRTAFADAFWWAEYNVPADQLSSRAGLLALLKAGDPGEWPAAVAEFRQALKQAEAGQAERELAYQALRVEPAAEQRVRECVGDLTEANRQLTGILSHKSRVDGEARDWNAERARRWGIHRGHQDFRPGFLQWLMTWGRAQREWRERDRYLSAEVLTAEQAVAATHQELRRLSDAQAQAQRVVESARDALRQAEHELDLIASTLAQARTDLGDHFPGQDWFGDRRRRELTAPWTDPAWNTTRTELFLAALRLHKAFLRGSANKMRQTLHGAMDVVSGEVPKTAGPSAVLAAWQALFLVVPVVSTTFASLGRMFGQVGAEALGWLLVDEAGQATPQGAVGALWRTRNAVVVGDPLQLEPITTVPFSAEQAIRREFAVDEQWLTSRTSVQRLADRITPLGTELSEQDGNIWVGAPLAVHRRCQEPMFGIANDIAYDGMMVHATARSGAKRFATAYPTLPPSKWIDVVGRDTQGHWVPAEGKELEHILDVLAGLEFPMSEVLVIAPFADVAKRVEAAACGYGGLVAGTIHRSQGRQADIVILVLGTAPQQTGARAWASKKPNLLNVAASRAKHRLYVIGNRDLWSRNRNFDLLARRLPRGEPKGAA
ncbi:hypothetical protein JOD54_006225 [Actinokineospora baliensis]|uniref:caspase, EACC1-associated type n=1 Tax=Actinokineospora baliensis TaxID=547056 RepID=UPI001EF77427|nr:caspase family protein [Actinokineospora baliensis]MBM7776021.1 hypothetical protein [Actinokineospora baliensis]